MSLAKRALGFVWFAGFVGLVSATGAWAYNAPDCMDGNQVLGIGNQQAIDWKRTAPLGVPFRARIAGHVTRVFPDRNHHAHFEIEVCDEFDGRNCDVIEVVYSEDFGDMPDPAIGAQVEACGDFINAYAKNNGYPPSPSGALIHWVHRSNSARHAHGYVILDEVLYGFGPDRRPERGNGGRGGRGGRGNRDDRNDRGNRGGF